MGKCWKSKPERDEKNGIFQIRREKKWKIGWPDKKENIWKRWRVSGIGTGIFPECGRYEKKSEMSESNGESDAGS